MSLNYVYVARKDLARGMDTYSPKSSIPEGFSENLQNVDTNASGKLSTRKGYEGYYGWVPMRVTQVEHDGTTIRFYFADAQSLTLDLTKVGPLVVYGHLSGDTTGDTPAGDWTTADAVRYYTTFTIASKAVLTAGSGTVTRTAAQHGYTSANLWVGLAENSTPDTSNQIVIPDVTKYNRSTYQVDLDYTVGASTSAYVYFKDVTTDAGNTYVHTASAVTVTADSGTDLLTAAGHGFEADVAVYVSSTGDLPAPLVYGTQYYVNQNDASSFYLSATEGGGNLDLTTNGTGTITVTRAAPYITAATHNLNTYNIIAKCWDTSVTPSQEVTPQQVVVNTTGKVTVSFSGPFSGVIQLVAVTPDFTKMAGATGPGSLTLEVESPGSPFVFPAAYIYNSVDSQYESVLIDSWEYDETADTVAIDYTLASIGLEQVYLYWTTGQTTANAVEVTDTGATSEDWTDTLPQLTVWGLDHAGSYRDTTLPGGHVTWLDTYRKEDEARVVCGLGGNGFTARTYAEVGTDYNLGMAYTNLRGRLSASVTLGPAFSDAAITRSRGGVQDSTVVDGYAVVTAATYVSSGVVDYTITWGSRTGSVVDGGCLDVSRDYLTVTGLPSAAHTGSFKITAVVSDSSATTVLRCANAAVTGDVHDCADAAGGGGIFTDYFQTIGPIAWLPNDQLIIPGITENYTWTIKSNEEVDPATGGVYIAGVTAEVGLTAGLQIFCQRTTAVVPLRTAAFTATASAFVRGDMLTVSSLARRPRVLQVSTFADTLGSLSGDGTTMTVTVGSAHGFNVGDTAVLYYNVDYSGEYTITDVPTTTTFQVAAAGTSGSAYVCGKSIRLDETVTIQDGNSADTWTTVGRWIPMEAPTTAFDLAPSTYVYHLDANAYENQDHVRSTSLNDSLYLTNGNDEVFKWDGTSLQQAGLPRWQLGVFTHVDTTSSAVLSTALTGTFSSAALNGTIKTATSGLAAGDRIYNSTQTQYAFITDVQYDGTDYTLVVRPDDNITTWADTDAWSRTSRYKYTVRLSMQDQNGYSLASASVQSEDLVVDVPSAGGSVVLKLLPPPAFGAYDYDRIEVEVYRTKANGSEYYLVSRQLLDFDEADNYVLIEDTLQDSLLTRARVDSITTALGLGAELGTAWEAPPRAKHITSLDNRLILGNLTGWPEVSLLFKPLQGVNTLSAANLAGKIVTFRKDSTSTSTTCDIANVARFEFLKSDAISFTFDTADVDTGTDTFTEADHGLLTGQTVRFTDGGSGLPTVGAVALSASTTYFAIPTTSSTFKIASTAALAMAGTALDIDNAGGNGNTLTSYSGVGVDPTAITVTATTFVVTSNAHGLVAGNWVYLFHGSDDGGNDLRFAGWYQVSGVTTDTFTVTTNTDNVAATANDVDRWVAATTKTDVPVWLGTDYNLAQRDGNPANSDNLEIQVANRLAAAINCSHRSTTTTLTAWLSAFSGDDYQAGEVIIRCPRVLDTTPEVVAPASVATLQFFVNDLSKAANAETAFVSKRFPSRLVRSYPNYPELIDAPFASDPAFSDSVIDINPADGQEITAMIPFFGESATGSGSQLSQNLLVFKTNSVYLVDISTKAVQRLATNGQGCTASRSVANTQDGVVFANESGVYRIGRDYRALPIGLALTGYWRDTLTRASVAQAYGHHYQQGRRYKLSVPVSGGLFPSRVVVYDYDREGRDQEYGAWTTYTNHPAVGWCNLGDEAFWASTAGDVFMVRDRGEASDYRDEADAVANSVVVLRSEDFDIPGTRKAVAAATTLVELEQTDLTGLTVYTAINLANSFTQAGNITLDSSEFRHHTFRTVPPARRGTHLQIKYVHSTKDEALVLTGVQYQVAQLSGKLVPDTGDR